MTPRRAPPGPLDRVDRLEFAHALRTPLTALSLGLGLLGEGQAGALAPAQVELVRLLAGEVVRLREIIDQSLRTEGLGSYHGPLERVPIELAPLIDRALGPLEPQAAALGLRFERSLDPDVVVVGDPIRLGWVIASLAGNALRFSASGGAVELSLARRRRGVELLVADRGPGIPTARRVSLFDREASQGFTLVLVREIAEAHGGKVEARPRRGGGSVFRLFLPAHRPPGARRKAAG
jgi:signal transduction histidine kinase